MLNTIHYILYYSLLECEHSAVYTYSLMPEILKAKTCLGHAWLQLILFDWYEVVLLSDCVTASWELVIPTSHIREPCNGGSTKPKGCTTGMSHAHSSRHGQGWKERETGRPRHREPSAAPFGFWSRFCQSAPSGFLNTLRSRAVFATFEASQILPAWPSFCFFLCHPVALKPAMLAWETTQELVVAIFNKRSSCPWSSGDISVVDNPCGRV